MPKQNTKLTVKYIQAAKPKDNVTNTHYTIDGSENLFTIWDAGGEDVLDASGESTPNILDLRNVNDVASGVLEHGSRVGDSHFWIARGAHIENAIGGSGNDTIYGSDAFSAVTIGAAQYAASTGNNRLEGGAGNDIIHGNGGNDTLYGGDGVDHLYGGDGNDTLHAGRGDVMNPMNTAADVLAGGADADTYVITRGEFGRIIIDDTDGTLLFDRQLIAGEAVYVGANQWTIRGHNATMQNGDLVISGPGGSVTLANFSGGEYGAMRAANDNRLDGGNGVGNDVRLVG